MGRANGLERDCVVSCDNLTTVPTNLIGGRVGFLLDAQEGRLAEAIHAALALEFDE